MVQGATGDDLLRPAAFGSRSRRCMRRRFAILWHVTLLLLAGAAYYFVVLPRTPELMGRISHAVGTTGRIICAVLIGLTALPVVFTLLRTRQPESNTPRLALRLQTGSIVAHVLAAVLIAGTAVSEIWLSPDTVGQWLFGVYGAAAAIAVLGVFSFYLSLLAEYPPRPPKPAKVKRRDAGAEDVEGGAEVDDAAAPLGTDADEAAPAVAVSETDDAESTPAQDAEAQEAEAQDPESQEAESQAAAQAEPTEYDDLPSAEDTVAVEPPRGGLRNRRPSGKSGGSHRRRRARGSVAVDE
jgi:hypothetical protein